jgi:valyl-tRNA synthetase
MKTDRYNFSETEKSYKTKWQDLDIYKFSAEDQNIFSIDTPPPTISGSLHIGHVFSYCQTDFIARYQRMIGKNVFYPCGFDNNGLPTERLVEKTYKVNANRTEKKEFLDLCEKISNEKISEFKDLFQRLGFSFDWNLQYSTNDERCHSISQKSFLDLYSKGLIYKKLTPTFWDTVDQTAIAQAEVEEKEFESFMNYIFFQTEDGENIIIATTRPELLPSCVAIFFNPEDGRYQHLKGKRAIVPIFNHGVMIIPDEDVDIEKGTGLVMCCTFGDEMDVKWVQKHKLEVVNSIDKYGKMEIFQNKKVEEAREFIIEKLKTEELLKNQDKIQHNVKCAERSGAKLEIIPTYQWYIRTLEYKEELLKQAKKINWFPQKMRIRIEQWIDGIKWDWCISRQRYLGVPIPVWYDQNTGKIIIAKNENIPVDPKMTSPLGYNKENIIPETSVLDTWATSALSPQINNVLINQKDEFKSMNLRPQAHEIIRTWAFYTILRTFLSDKQIPWHNIMISGWCLAEDKTKMSKSKGNTIDPINLLNQYGTDVVRYWAASASLGADTYYSENVFLIGKKLMNKIWNASKFIGQFLIQDIDETDITYPTDVWIMTELSNLIKESEMYFNNYDYSSVKNLIEKFFLQTYCDNYLELVKTRAYNDVFGHKSAINSLSLSLLIILKLFAPFFPYITEEIYSQLFFNEVLSIHTKGNWPINNLKTNEAIPGKDIVLILEKVREFKSSKNLSIKSQIDSMNIITSKEILKEIEDDIKNTCNVSNIKWEFIESGETLVSFDITNNLIYS